MVRRCIRYGGERGNFYAQIVDKFLEPFDEIYQFAADMGGAGFIFTGENDADIMYNSAQINLNVLEQQRLWNETTDRIRLRSSTLDLLCTKYARKKQTTLD